MAEQLKHKGISVIPGWKLCRNCHQKTKDLADDEVDINECDDGHVDEFETSLQIVEQGNMLNESFGIIGISPLKTHAIAKTNIISTETKTNKWKQMKKKTVNTKMKQNKTSHFLM